MIRVDCPRQIGRIPSAIGSRVPICPAFFTPSIFFIWFTMEKEVGP